jgi:ribonuclease BN (tRNA processing enzyme)
MSSNNAQIRFFHSLFLSVILALFSSLAFADNNQHHNPMPVDQVKGDLSVMVLGSGGPGVTAEGRASAGYLIFTDGKPRVLMDVGGGVHKNFVNSGANIKDLDIVLLSHLHIDHMGDLSPVIKALYFQNRAFNLLNGTVNDGDERTAPIRIFGPDQNGIGFPAVLGAEAGVTQYPSIDEFVHSHYDLNTGDERYLNIFTRAISAGIFAVKSTSVSPDWTNYNPKTIINEKGLKIIAVGVNHGPVPALAFRIEYKGKSIVYSGDTSSQSTDPKGNPLPNGGNMVAISKNADLLIYDTAIMNDAPNGPNDQVFFTLHTTPNRMGEVVTAAGVKKLVLSHITAITQSRLKEVADLVRAQGFKGEISAAHDLKVYNVGLREPHH